MQASAHAATRPLVSVVITTYNHARYLPDAIRSVLEQTTPGVELLVVDDGSTDHTAEIVSQFSEAAYVRQKNQGLPAARNRGLQEVNGRYVVFLDADDRLLPNALESGLRCYAAYPESAYVAGRYRHITADGRPIGRTSDRHPHAPYYIALLRGNYIGMHATVMYRRDLLQQAGGFDASLPACEDYEMYLRLARRYPAASHDEVIAEYRLHDGNMSRDVSLMLPTALAVLRAQKPFAEDPRAKAAMDEGMRNWKQYYVGQVRRCVDGRSPAALQSACRVVWTAVRCAPAVTARRAASLLRNRLKRTFRSGSARNGATETPRRGRAGAARNSRAPRVGTMRFGDFRRLEPVSRRFGFDRGGPIDRYYVESFLAVHAHSVGGRVLEVGDNTYTARFGGDRVTRSDVLHVSEGYPSATFVGDLADGAGLPSRAFDCIILTQTLHLIYDVKAALRTLRRVLKPGGVLLLTVPGTISQIEDGEWADSWHWGFSERCLRTLCEEAFVGDHVDVAAHGSVLSSIAFLQGLGAIELSPAELDHHDPLYPLLLTARTRRSAGREYSGDRDVDSKLKAHSSPADAVVETVG